MPYDPQSSIPDQVRESIESSLQNLRHLGETDAPDDTYIDALVLHSPMSSMDETMEVWHMAEQFVPHKIRHLGISNCNQYQLMELYKKADIKPAVVQNRFYPKTRFDVGLRKFCRDNSIIYQSFWTLTANPQIVWSAEVGVLANQVGITPQAALYCLVLALDNTVILDGTKNGGNMLADLKAPDMVKSFAEKHRNEWLSILERFKRLIGEPAVQ